MLNRSALVVTAKEPFLEWLRKLPDPVDDSTTLERINEDAHVYLLPEIAMEEDREELIQEYASYLIERELHSWWTDESVWPEKRDKKMLKDWFHLSHHSIIEDLCWEALDDTDDE